MILDTHFLKMWLSEMLAHYESPFGTNWKTSENQSVNHGKFICSR